MVRFWHKADVNQLSYSESAASVYFDDANASKLKVITGDVRRLSSAYRARYPVIGMPNAAYSNAVRQDIFWQSHTHISGVPNMV